MTNSENELTTKRRWKQALEEAIAHPEEPILAITFRRAWNSAARPVLVRGIDKNEYSRLQVNEVHSFLDLGNWEQKIKVGCTSLT